MNLSEHDREILYALEAWHRRENGGARPMDLGAWNGSHHSNTLNKLIRRGWVSRKHRSAPGSRSSYRYSLTELGQTVAAELIAKSQGDRQ